MNNSHSKPLLVIVGETASGKSSLALEIAERQNGELICADSWTVYKGYDIGTAKPSKSEKSRVPHHLLDVADPLEGFSAALFKDMAVKAIDEIHSRGHLPILVGGTGLYIDSVLYDYGFLPTVEASERERLNNMAIPELLDEMQARGLSTAGIDTRNKRRLVRLLEANGQKPVSRSMRSNTVVVGLRVPREELLARIEARVERMFAAGLEAEVARLAKKYGWNVEPMKGIGYREFKNYFEGSETFEQIRQRIISSTMQLAKKQRTWFKRNQSIHWLSNRSNAVEIVTTILNKL